MLDAEVRLGGEDQTITVRINGAQPTFRLASDAIRAAALSDLDDRSLDFLEIAATIFAADNGTRRGGSVRQNMGRAWRRNFAFRIPVRHPDLWNRPEVSTALIDATEVLTEDRVSFEFIEAEHRVPSEPYLAFKPEMASFRADEIILFSGGLDSFAGALETLSLGEKRVVLVTHRSAQKTTTRQVFLGRYLQKKFEGRVLHLHITAQRAGKEAVDETQRSRTLLFTAMGQAVAHAFGADRLSFYENGVVSHNLPISQQIVGTMATRTTHPLALTKLNDLLGFVWPEGARIENRYQWLTKTDVLRRIHENGASHLIPKAVSCTSIREQTQRHTHCGACSQCIDRRFAILAAELDRYDKPDDYKTDVFFGARDTTRSRTMAQEWTRHSLRLGQLDEARAMTEYGLEIARILRGFPDLRTADVLRKVVDLHRRHAEAVRATLIRIVASHAEEISAQALPPSSLIVMHVGQTGATVPQSPDASNGLRFGALPNEIDRTLVNLPGSDASEGLEVAFFIDGTRHVIAANGLGRVHGGPAMVAHGLKPAFDEDRAEGRLPEDHRYSDTRETQYCKEMSKGAFRANVKRCRHQLAEFFELIHGTTPDTELLIQSAQGRGYRLDPLTRPIDPKRLDGAS